MSAEAASALVSGGASGLGLATAARLRAEGLAVVSLDRAEGVDVVGDVSDPEAVEAAVEACIAAAPLRLCVACAGVAPVERLLSRDGAPHALESFRRAVEVNLTGSFNVLRLAAEAMAGNAADGDGQRGLIVLTASIAAWEGQIGQTAYAASKAGIAGLVLPAARELAERGIRVVGVAPGLMDTPLLAGLPERVRAELAASVPNPPRLGRPDEFAELVLRIAQTPMINGSVVRLDGALRMPPR